MAKRKADPTQNATPPPTEAPAGYTVLARRYRPQLFEELVGQEPVAEALVNALESSRVAHAYLFTGARGVGKTSTARILAKCLNCIQGPTPTPCNECDSCQGIASGEDVDVIEIDGASNNKVEEIRELRSNVQYRPSRGRFKIYIIDEVHMLSTSAFNALLKTLEEPPPHVKFIFATTEVQKIPVTILSRCQRFDFAGIGTPRIVERLKSIVASEKMQAEDEALEFIARRAGGSMRDAQSLLDQLLAFGGERLAVEQVYRLLGMASDERVGALAAAVLQGDAKTALELVAKAADSGMQVGEFLDQLIGYWRDLMIVSSAGLDGLTLNVRSSQRDAVKKQADQLSLDAILAGLDVLTSAKARVRTTNHPRVLLEMTLVRLARLDQLVPIAQLIQSLGQPTDVRPAQPATAKAATSPSAQSSPGLAARFASTSDPAKKNDSTRPEPLTTAGEIALDPQTLPQVWEKILAQTGMALGMKLRRGNFPAIFGPNTLVICFPSVYNQERQHCQEAANVARIEELLRSATGQAWKVRIEQDAATTEDGTPKADSPEQESSQARSRRLRGEALSQPLLSRAIEVLDAQVLDLPEGFGATATPPAPDRTEQPDSEET